MSAKQAIAKLYLVVRANLSAGQQAVQACHALQQFNTDHPALAHSWTSSSNTLALLRCPDS